MNINDSFLAAVEEAMALPRNVKIPQRGVLLLKPHFEIDPSAIKMGGHFWHAFDHNETEISAWWLCKLAQQNGDWRSFTRADIQKLYRESHQHTFSFNHLVERGVGYGMPGGRYLTGGGWIVAFGWEAGIATLDPHGDRFFFTDEFVWRCYLSSNGLKDELKSRFPEERERQQREYF